jgi:hypothetical protein
MQHVEQPSITLRSTSNPSARVLDSVPGLGVGRCHKDSAAVTCAVEPCVGGGVSARLIGRKVRIVTVTRRLDFRTFDKTVIVAVSSVCLEAQSVCRRELSEVLDGRDLLSLP